MTKQESKIDNSVNFIEEALTGFLESRYVRRVDDYFICYLSSQSGCNKGCRMCHLTATKQTKFQNATCEDYLLQASRVLENYKKDMNIPAKYVTFSFMARGEALANTNLLANADDILFQLGKLAHKNHSDLGVRFSISTIMPKSLNQSLVDTFKIIHPTLYYSLYSTNEAFRKKWLPQAKPVDEALSLLKDYQIFTKKVIKIHYCFIENENDSESDITSMLKKIDDYNLDIEFNLVRYNPFSPIQGRESSLEVIERNMNIINDALPGKSKIINRIGTDVSASCGMFYNQNKILSS